MLNITEVRIKKINKGDLLAAASICIDDCFIIREIKLLNGKNGRYISMPKRKVKNRNFRHEKREIKLSLYTLSSNFPIISF